MYRGAGNPRSIRNAAPSTDLSYVAKRIEDAFGKYETALQKDKGAALFQPLPAKRQRQLDKFLGQRMDYFEQKGDKDMVSAIKHYMVQTMMKAEEAKISEDYQKSFFAWLMGQGKQSDHTRTPWGREPHALELPSVRKVLEQILEALYITKTYLIKLIFRTPQTLGEYAIYYKYILHCEDWIASEDAWIFLEFPALIDGAKWFEGENGLGRFMDDGEPRNPPGENLNNPPSKQRSDAVRQILHCLDNSLFTPGQPDPIAVLVKEEAKVQGMDITDAQAEEAAKAIKDDPVKREQVEKAIEKKSAVANEKKKEEAKRATQEQQAKIASDWAKAAEALKVIAEEKKRKEEALQRQASQQNRAKLVEEQKAAEQRVREAAANERERLKRVEEEGKNTRKRQEERSVAQNKKKAEQHRIEQRKLEETKNKPSKPRRVQPVVQPATVEAPAPPPEDLPIELPTTTQPVYRPPGYSDPTEVYDPAEFSTVPQLTPETVQRRTGETVAAEIAEPQPSATLPKNRKRGRILAETVIPPLQVDPTEILPGRERTGIRGDPDPMEIDPNPEPEEIYSAPESSESTNPVNFYIEQHVVQPQFQARQELTDQVNRLIELTRPALHVPDVIVNRQEIIQRIEEHLPEFEKQTRQIQESIPDMQQDIRATIPQSVPDEERREIANNAMKKMTREVEADLDYINFAKNLVREKPIPLSREIEEVSEVVPKISPAPASHAPEPAEQPTLLLTPPVALKSKPIHQERQEKLRQWRQKLAEQKARMDAEEEQLQIEAKEWQEQNLGPKTPATEMFASVHTPPKQALKVPTYLMNQTPEKVQKFRSRVTRNLDEYEKKLLKTVKEAEQALDASAFHNESRRNQIASEWEKAKKQGKQKTQALATTVAPSETELTTEVSVSKKPKEKVPMNPLLSHQLNKEVNKVEDFLQGLKADARVRKVKLRSEAVAKLREARKEQQIAGLRVAQLVEHVQSEVKKGRIDPNQIKHSIGRFDKERLREIASDPTPENKAIMQDLVKTLGSMQNSSREFQEFTTKLQDKGTYMPHALPTKPLPKKRDRRPRGTIVAGRKVVA